jgi:hypothetical protein
VIVLDHIGPPDVDCLFLRCEVRALYPGALGRAVEGVLRRVTSHAALQDAVLESRALALAAPRVSPPGLVERLGSCLWREAGLPVSFGPVWTPLPDGAQAAVGTNGLDDGYLREALRANPCWDALVGGDPE